MQMKTWKPRVLWGAMPFILCAGAGNAVAVPLPGGTLDPLSIPKYVTPLVIPPVMKVAACDGGSAGMSCTIRDNDYDIAVRQFQQQILPGGIWDALSSRSDGFPATTLWSYGPAADPLPDSSGITGNTMDVGVAPAPNSQFNYPAYTMENIKDSSTTVNWINDLVDANGDALPHLFAVDQSLHWANPVADCESGEVRTDCAGNSALPYTGPVPIVTHVHGAHVAADSDGYTEAWWLPDARNIQCVSRHKDGTLKKTPQGLLADGTWDVACEGTIANQLTDRNGKVNANTNTKGNLGASDFVYQNDQPSTTLWYHDHSLGMTRLNVYAGPAGFWLIRDDAGVGGETGLGADMVLPGPAPVAGEDLAITNFPAALGGSRHKYREIPIVIQGRSFNIDGSLFYPDNRAFFEGLNVSTVDANGDPLPDPVPPQFPGEPELQIDMDPATSDIAPIWNPEAFFNTMVVNGVTWPNLEVAPAQYRFRLLNGSNSRFINLALKITNPADNTKSVPKTVYLTKQNGEINRTTTPVSELDFYQIGAEQSLKPTVTAVRTGFITDLSKTTVGEDGVVMNPVAASSPQQALLMGLAERADVIVDFRGLPDGTIITMTNTAADAPFGGFPDVPADPGTTGQVMRFVVNSAHLGLSPTDELRDPVTHVVLNPSTAATNVEDLVVDPVPLDNFTVAVTNPIARELALIEEESALICVEVDLDGNLVQVPGEPVNGICDPLYPAALPMAPMAAVLGTVNPLDGNSMAVTLWSDPIATNVNADGSGTQTAETWNLWNVTEDAHPIHVHLVGFKVLGRSAIGGGASVVTTPTGVEAWEDGWKDTVITYPGEVTSIAADFDINGLYVWHCHIVEHEDNEMMVPMCVGVAGVDCPAQLFD